jgi:two-component sensor histidine kinase
MTWSLNGSDGGAPPSAVEIRWSERGGPAVRPPARRGFGSRLVERGLAQQLQGEVTLDFAPEGIDCRIRLPRSDKVCAA